MRNETPIAITLSRFPAVTLSARTAIFPRNEFHILAEIRKKYSFDDSLFETTGNVIFPNFHAVRVFAKKLNDRRPPERSVKAGHLNAMGLIDEINHFMLRRYEEVENPNVFARAIGHLGDALGPAKLASTIHTFGTLIPPLDVYRGRISIEDYLAQSIGRKKTPEILLEELILLWFANINPAFSPFKELFSDHDLRESSAYQAVIDATQEFFKTEKPTGADGQSILDLLRAPILASPHSLEGQLSYIRRHWGMLLSRHFLNKMIGAGDLVKEESRAILPGGQPETVVPQYSKVSPFGEFDYERFTADLDWMPNVVLIAKNSYVWLDQLSKTYQRRISTLDQVPDEELDRLARWNITALWLIGIWERSPASQRIKQMTGNPEAVASAYSIFDYEIARDLGGENSFQNLRGRAWQRGIRLAGDMVPNHVGIYSKWVIEHPEYFIQSDYSPFPNYTFTGANLSGDPEIEIRIEDGYWSRRDAAVVFQRVDRRTGAVAYIYHGNDGTHTPWNDTAQLDFLKPEVREAVMQAIMHVAGKFSIIRFDAAMVLTKQHFQRLWYPQPGSGGDIPSRADRALTKEEFDRLMPNEFWRETVDRVNSEMPHTLLLAEAFWLLEGYFVRTLGMHRVYNSAFMHMMMKEENSKYRELISNTLSFNPEILKRYVNFMSNPDERTAIEQFGKDDKYFGVAMMMVTMPGLPMLAHGQVEGYSEKYGMEYQRAYYSEEPNRELIARHEREIFPVLNKRWLFSQVTNFEFYDFLDGPGNVNPNVFCYSNRAGNVRTLFCYNNRYETSTGAIGKSVAKVQTDGSSSSGRTVGEGLGLKADERVYYVLKEHTSGLEYIRNSKELLERGLFVSLQGYQYQLFLEFREVDDAMGEYRELAGHLDGRGVARIEQALRELKLAPVIRAFSELINDTTSMEVVDRLVGTQRRHAGRSKIPESIVRHYRMLAREVVRFARSPDPGDQDTAAFMAELATALHVTSTSGEARNTLERLFGSGELAERAHGVKLLVIWIVCRHLDRVLRRLEGVTAALGPPDRVLVEAFPGDNRDRQLLDVLISHESIIAEAVHRQSLDPMTALLHDDRIQSLLGVNKYNDIVYFGKEQFEELADWLLLTAFITDAWGGIPAEKENTELCTQMVSLASQLKRLAEHSGYRLNDFRILLASASFSLSPEAPAH